MNGNAETPPHQQQQQQLQQPTIPPFNIREVYKAGWLKRVPSSTERRNIPFGKKYERLWGMLCIHDDVQPYFEFYVDAKSSTVHQPLWAISLAQCMHISPSIAIHDDIHEFAVTIREMAVLRLGAPTREHMNEWVDVLRNRLRDIGVLEPKENFYAPMPDSSKSQPASLIAASTRDPNSPLPLPPVQVANQDPVYADTAELMDQSAAVPNEHVTVIAVNEEAANEADDPFDDTAPQSHVFSTRVRISSAPSSISEALDDEENRYETIFNAPSQPSRAQRPAPPELPPPNPTNPPAPVVQPEHEAVSRSVSMHRAAVHHQVRHRDGLRRTMSVGAEHPPHPPRGIPPPPPPLLIPAPHPPIGRPGRDGIVLLPRPPLFVPAPPPPPPSIHHPALGPRHGSPLFRTALPHANGALQPVTTNHGLPETGYSLKERQVARLRMEMQHPAGVRIILKKKDCVNTIALVDALGAVWVAGWRQKEKPLLYNVFHIGDQIIRVGHCAVSSTSDVNRMIKSESSGQIEFIVRRVPFGRVFHLRRETDGQSLGIATEPGGGAEIREIAPGGLAAQQGVPASAANPLAGAVAPPTPGPASSPSACSWTLTEINGRPLNLCSKEGEARDRLNAVGKAVSILIQPTDFVKLLKKQLKSQRGYKDYLLG